MFKQVFRLTFVTFIWKQYKRYIVSTTLLFSYLWFVGFAHSEYLEFAASDGVEISVGSSFFMKWVALISGVAAYILFHYLAPSRKKQKKEAVKTKVKILPLADGEHDPFDQIRHKDKLRTRAEIIIEQQQKD